MNTVPSSSTLLRGRFPRGFSLIELTVVLGAICLLIAILLPVISRARSQAMQTKCMSNLRQLSIVYVLYANQNQGQIPIGYCNSMPWTGYLLWNRDSAGTPKSGYPLMGCLFKEGLLTVSPQAFYCPSQVAANWQFNTPQNPWPSLASDPPQNMQIRVGYTARPTVEWDPKTSIPVAGLPLPQLQRMQGKVILADVIGIPTLSPDYTSVHHRRLNVLAGDSSVRSVGIAAYEALQKQIQPYTPAPGNVPISLYLDETNSKAIALWNALDRN